VVIGPRSAVFLPLQNLRLIILDEEHEATYKSEITPKYHAKAVAQMRMQQANGVVLLASATPSLESYEAAKRGEIGYLTLKNRIGKAKLPKVQLVDMREELRCGNPQVISRRLHQAMKETLESQQQVMLLLNRRGHSTFVNCRQCGHVMKCKHCDVALTYHHYNQKLKCHYCGIEQDVPKVCPSCQSPYIRFFGNGTEKVEAYLNEHFSAYGVGRMDFDTTSGKEGHHKILEAFRSGKINVLVGTQMIAKGHDFPKVTLVGIVAADMSLYLQDFRSGERTFQLLTQALGRSGRGENPGQVIIQTYDPDHMVLQRIAHHKQHLFYEEELKNRQMMGYPPYTHIFSLLVTGKTEKEVIHTTHLLYQYYQHYNKKGLFRLMGPVAATISKVADEYRWKITILGEDRAKLMLYGKYCLEKCLTHKEVGRVKIYWDIDPVGMI
jgi:primosomal protein N' (replication factor Y)